jgi:hypothetical protein
MTDDKRASGQAGTLPSLNTAGALPCCRPCIDSCGGESDPQSPGIRPSCRDYRVVTVSGMQPRRWWRAIALSRLCKPLPSRIRDRVARSSGRGQGASAVHRSTGSDVRRRRSLGRTDEGLGHQAGRARWCCLATLRRVVCRWGRHDSCSFVRNLSVERARPKRNVPLRRRRRGWAPEQDLRAEELRVGRPTPACDPVSPRPATLEIARAPPTAS